MTRQTPQVWGAILFWFAVGVPALHAASSIAWQRAAYWDPRYPTCWTGGSEIRNGLEYDGYRILDADQLKTWMQTRIADRADSVVVFCQDIAPDTVVETISSRCTLRQYLDAGGKIVWYADIPLYYQGHRDGSRTVLDVQGAMMVLSCDAAGGPWDGDGTVTFTDEGQAWGLTARWQSDRPAIGASSILATDPTGYAAAWVVHYVPGDDHRGFVRFFDRPGVPDLQDVRRLAEYPNVPKPLDWDNAAERADDIVAAFFYPWYGNPDTSGRWVHWDGESMQPPARWTSRYLPNYPESGWNPAVQLYDSTNPQVLRWQDRALVRAGIDIAISSWWGVGTYEDQALDRAIRACKSVQWCIYYEQEAYGDPSTAQIYQDIKSVLDRFGPTGNYARIDGKWLVFVYGAGGDETADRWRAAKALLKNAGYPVYINADTGDAGPANAPDPWDAVHRYNPVVHHGSTSSLPNVDDSAWVSPGFWAIGQSQPVLSRSLAAFASACEAMVSERQRARFLLVETWNEWHEGTQIESGQEVDPRTLSYRPAGYDYGNTFLDALPAAAGGKLRWSSANGRPVVPVLLTARDLVWESQVTAEGNSECRIPGEDVRVGRQIVAPDAGVLTIATRARSVAVISSRVARWPEVLIYVDQMLVGRRTVGPLSSLLAKVSVALPRGVHTVEIGVDVPDGTVWNLILTSLDLQWAGLQVSP
jgi:hypothetical protein